ncbi:Phytanoyl-CoA dioxygenase [Penicillium macrosclerotiorum]|uniref:Phytanoyl-CoA dioxygenase n=1 Tax=Penicillium macrosclerotiorum TaxID=303699 RepID=UPI0025479D1D|nr:Phytanoyl-CoA dioxygenase [Penicillium macrosclerotiorum]KAJ5690519.1 Phytanoyl-CoA dioxygenase [Penicillium macrosclerotiorum]
MTTATPHLDALQRDGFVVVRNLLTPTEVAHYRTIATQATALARTGTWPHFRTHLLHPSMPGRDAFAACYFSPSILAVAEELMGVTSLSPASEPLVLELFNLLVAPETRDFELRWHRDDIPETVAGDEELALLAAKAPGGRQSHCQYNLALCEDMSLVVVPGSHARARTETERAADPYQPELPDQLVVKLEPGDAVFYNSNILHRGVYRAKEAGAEESRLTLHGSIGLKGEEGEGEAEKKKVRATAVLQHGVGAWVHRDDAAFGLGERAERMRANLVAMGTGEGVGFSLQG